MKHCKRCDTSKPVSEFHKNPRLKSGVNTYCKMCVAISAALYREARSTQEREKALVRLRDYRKANKARLSEHNKAYRDKNKEWLAELAAQYRRDNRGKVNNWNIVRFRKIKQRTFPEQKNAIEEFYHNCPRGYHVDHVIPLTHRLVSGLHVLANLQYLPASDNVKKHNKFVIT